MHISKNEIFLIEMFYEAKKRKKRICIVIAVWR